MRRKKLGSFAQTHLGNNDHMFFFMERKQNIRDPLRMKLRKVIKPMEDTHI